MNRNTTVEDKFFGSNLSAFDIELSSLASHISNDYAQLLRDIDIINFEVQYTNIVATVSEIVNPYLKNFKLILTMDTFKHVK